MSTLPESRGVFASDELPSLPLLWSIWIRAIYQQPLGHPVFWKGQGKIFSPSRRATYPFTESLPVTLMVTVTKPCLVNVPCIVLVPLFELAVMFCTGDNIALDCRKF